MRLTLLGPSGLRVSELALGTMTFGEDWGWGADAAESRKVFGRFAEAGGNFVDTANNYTNGSSERIVGECIRDERERFVVASKYTLRMADAGGADANLGGNSKRAMVRSVEASLRRLNTDYLDLLYLHMWDFTTPVDEVLQAAHQLALAGKVLYFGFSDTPAWVVSHAIARAEQYGWPKPVAIQVPYSVRSRDPERDIVPMAKAFGLTVTAWGVLSAGALTGKYSRPADGPRREKEMPERFVQAGAEIERLAGEVGCTPAQLAIAWVRSRSAPILPIVGARTEEQLVDNLGALQVTLDGGTLERLDALAGFEIGFPMRFLTDDHVRGLIHGETWQRLDLPRRVIVAA